MPETKLGYFGKASSYRNHRAIFPAHENVFIITNDFKCLFLSNVAEEQILQSFHFRKGMADKLKMQTDDSQKSDSTCANKPKNSKSNSGKHWPQMAMNNTLTTGIIH